ncbi:MAG: dihydropteroate synthase [Candidatus Eisenbacteria bacterium]|nr:dihydropteroate synthase [Candidatus Eisenbacteria bacterium]
MADVLSPRVLLISAPEDAAREMRKIGVSEAGVRAMAPKAQTVVLKVAGASVPVAHILKQQMLSIGGDAAVACGVLTHEVESTDVLLMGTVAQLESLAQKLSYQQFGLPELGERIVSTLAALSPKPRLVLRARHHNMDLAKKVHVMGILNVTPDSFSDGGRFLQPSEALDHALEMAEDGADIIDVGGQSSRPGSQGIPESEELKRVVPVVERVHEAWHGPISVDTARAKVAEEAFKAGASIVNDITAFTADPAVARVVARFDAACVLMHMQGTPATMQDDPSYDDLMGQIAHFLAGAIAVAKAAGVADDQIVVDPGIGFGKTTAHNLAILRHLPELRALGKPILVGPSRKGFIGRILDLQVDDRLEGTLAAAAYAVAQGARILRVHDVKPVARAARIVEACLSSPA